MCRVFHQEAIGAHLKCDFQCIDHKKSDPDQKYMIVLVGVGTVALILDLGRKDVFTQTRGPLILILAFWVCKNHGTSVDSALKRLQNACARSRARIGKSRLSSNSFKNPMSSSEALSRLSRVSSTEAIRRLSTTIRQTFISCRRRSALKAITRKECFAKLDFVAQLSIQDMMTLFRYSVDMNQVDFNKKRFMANQNQLVRAIITAIDTAVEISRGGQTHSIKRSGGRSQGDVDALCFTAVTRIFAEWRTLRLVPEGYKRYAMGLNLAHRDALQNLAKLEEGVHGYLKHQELTSGDNSNVASPTLRQVLEFERDTNLHSRLPKLKDKSASSGLLWTKRQLHYQTSLFANSLEVPTKYATIQAGALAAYSEVYEQYHGWAIKQVFSHSFGGSPPLDRIWEQMNPPVSNTGADNRDQGFPARKMSDVSEEGEPLDNEFLAALENFGKGVARKWDDTLRLFNCVDHEDDDDQSRAQSLLMSSESHLSFSGLNVSQLAPLRETSSLDSDDTPISRDQAIKINTFDFVAELRPLLSDIGAVIREFNMDDPTRV